MSFSTSRSLHGGRGFETPFVLAFLFLCLTCVGATSYGAVIDAGSSGSRIYLFSWEPRSFQGLPTLTTPVQVVFVSVPQGVPGIDTAAGRASLPDLLVKAKEKLNGLGVFDYSQVPLFLKATAGMRILSVALRTSIMAEVSATLAASGFMFKQGWARTISGEEEGISGFISVNYLAGTLPGMAGVTSNAGTFGALDLGGASTQITFAPPAGVDIMSSQFDLRLSPTSQISVYTHSFLYMGQNEAVRRINELVVLNYTTNVGPYQPGALIPHPCFLTGTPQSLLSFTSTVANAIVNFTGSGNAADCNAFVAPLLLQGAQCLTDPLPTPLPTTTQGRALLSAAAIPPLPVINPTSPGSTCSINGIYQPPINVSAVKFVAFSSFSFIYSSLGVGLSAPLSDLVAATARFCSTPYSSAGTAFPNSTGAFQFRYCILGTYASQLLVNGYKIDPNAPGVVNVAAPSASPVSWALGNILYEANALPWSVECGSTNVGGGATPPSTIALAIVLSATLAGGVGYLVWRHLYSAASSTSGGGCLASGSGGSGGSGVGGSGRGFHRPAWDRGGSSMENTVITPNPL